MKAIIAYSLLVPLAFALSVYCCTLAFASRDSQPPQSSDLGLEVDSRDVDFGAVEQNRVVHGQFVLHNRSTAIIVVREVAKSCGCTTAEISAREIHPGGTAFLDVTWNTRSLRGRNSEAVTIVYFKNGETETLAINLTLRADIQPNVKSSTDQLEFESTLPTTKTITFHRADSTPLHSRLLQAGQVKRGSRLPTTAPKSP